MRLAVMLLSLATLAAACGDDTADSSDAGLGPPGATAALADPVRFVGSAKMLAERLARLGPPTPGVPRVVFLGDSLTYGFGLLRGELPWPELAARELAAEDIALEPVNAGLAGDTTAGGLRRLPALASLQPDVLVIELGGNDWLAGVPLETVRHNLRQIVEGARAMGARVLLVGLELPWPLAGARHGADFQEIFPALADELAVPLVPDLLDDVLGHANLLQADGLHPTAGGHAVLAENALDGLREVLDAD
jgi:acyl-CoA thioesterase I